MQTRDLINAIAADAGPQAVSLRRSWLLAAAGAVAVAAGAFLLMLGPRPDILEALHTLRFPLKFVVTITLALTAFSVLIAVSRPGGEANARSRLLLAAPALLAVAIVLELFVVPQSEWATRLIGSNSRLCMLLIPLIGICPLVIFLAALRYSAPTSPRLAGAAAGLFAGALAATFYAAHCPDDSPLFVATWYTIAIISLAAAGALIAPFVARW